MKCCLLINYRLNKLLIIFLACDPKLMPTFPQHRNLKLKKPSNQPKVCQTIPPVVPSLTDLLRQVPNKNVTNYNNCN